MKSQITQSCVGKLVRSVIVITISHLNIFYSAGSHPTPGVISDVCRQSFCICYDLSSSYVDGIIRDIKTDIKVTSCDAWLCIMKFNCIIVTRYTRDPWMIIRKLIMENVVNLSKMRLWKVSKCFITLKILLIISSKGNVLNQTQMAMMHAPNSPECMACYAWMFNWFEQLGQL